MLFLPSLLFDHQNCSYETLWEEQTGCVSLRHVYIRHWLLCAVSGCTQSEWMCTATAPSNSSSKAQSLKTDLFGSEGRCGVYSAIALCLPILFSLATVENDPPPTA